jgi:hypothetical protein
VAPELGRGRVVGGGVRALVGGLGRLGDGVGEAPESACSTAVALMGVAPMLVSAMRAEPMEPLERSTTAATPTVAQSCERRLNFL